MDSTNGQSTGEKKQKTTSFKNLISCEFFIYQITCYFNLTFFGLCSLFISESIHVLNYIYLYNFVLYLIKLFR